MESQKNKASSNSAPKRFIGFCHIPSVGRDVWLGMPVLFHISSFNTPHHPPNNIHNAAHHYKTPLYTSYVYPYLMRTSRKTTVV